MTALHTIHTENANSKAGIETHKLRLATCLPPFSQKSSISGRQSVITLPPFNSSFLTLILTSLNSDVS